jgi:hypothetical protein
MIENQFQYVQSVVNSQIPVGSLPLEPPSSPEVTIKMVLGGNRLSGCGLAKNYVQLRIWVKIKEFY